MGGGGGMSASVSTSFFCRSRVAARKRAHQGDVAATAATAPAASAAAS